MARLQNGAKVKSVLVLIEIRDCPGTFFIVVFMYHSWKVVRVTLVSSIYVLYMCTNMCVCVCNVVAV